VKIATALRPIMGAYGAARVEAAAERATARRRPACPSAATFRARAVIQRARTARGASWKNGATKFAVTLGVEMTEGQNRACEGFAKRRSDDEPRD
jgi:hypothetical protein